MYLQFLNSYWNLTGRAEPSRPSGGRRRRIADGVRAARLQRRFERPLRRPVGQALELSSARPVRGAPEACREHILDRKNILPKH